jgi:glycosyltransferase involved in cell wall biosynthesis
MNPSMRTHPKNNPVHLWTPGLFEFKGGIQTFSRYFCNSLQTEIPEISQHIFSLHDHGYPRTHSPSQIQQFHFAGNIPTKLRIPTYAAQVLAWGLIQQPRLVICTHLNLAVVANQLKQISGVPYWVIAHGFEAWKINKHSVVSALRNADRILSVSRFTRDQLITNYQLSADQISIFPNTFDSERFQIQDKPQRLLNKYHLDQSQPIIMTVNRLESGEEFKPYDQIIQSLPQIRNSIPDVHYLIVGSGNDRNRLERDIEQRGLNDCVTLAGFVPDDELGAHYSLCDLYAMPSKLEGFGIVFLEALASGKPVMASYLDGGQEAVCDGKLGALVNPESPEEIASCAIKILKQEYPNPLMYSPQSLRQAVIHTFGQAQFSQNLSRELIQSPVRESFFTPVTDH